MARKKQPLERTWQRGRDGFERRLLGERGAVHLEYVLIAVLMGTVLIVALLVLQGGLDNAYRNLGALLDAVR